MTKIELKLKLYSCLTGVPYDWLTDSEVDIMYDLSKDPEVQQHLEERKNKE